MSFGWYGAVGVNAEVLSSFGKNGQADPNAQLKVGGVGMTSVQGTGQTGIRTSAFKKGVLGNEKSATKFARPGMNDVNHHACPLPSLRRLLSSKASIVPRGVGLAVLHLSVSCEGAGVTEVPGSMHCTGVRRRTRC